MCKKLIWMLLALFCLNISVSAQEAKANAEKSESKTLEFMKSSGSFMKKEFYDLNKIKGVEYQVLILTDIRTNKKMGCLRLETAYSSGYSSDSYIGTLDADELDACIQCLEKLQSEILPSQTEVYTEFEYKTRDGVKLGAYFDKKKNNWQAFVYTKDYTSRSASFFTSENIPSIIAVMKQAKEMIAAKAK